MWDRPTNKRVIGVFVSFLLMVLVAFISSRAHAQESGESYFKQAFGIECPIGKRCVLPDNDGGLVDIFVKAALEIIRNKNTIAIDTDCFSACVIFADIARKHVCITPSENMAVHQSTVFVERPSLLSALGLVSDIHVIRHENQPQSPDIDRAIRKLGGYPEHGARIIPFNIAKRFWKVCPKSII